MVHLRMQCAKGSRGSCGFVLAADRPFRAQNTASRREAPGNGAERGSNGGGPATALISNNEEEIDDESCILAGRCYVSGVGKLRDRGGYRQNWICHHVQRPHR